MNKEIIFFSLDESKTPQVIQWLQKLDSKNRARINVRLARLKHGAYGDYKRIDSDLFELRFFFGKGYRIYFTEKNNQIILLLYAGDKDSQKRDIEKAKNILSLINQ